MSVRFANHLGPSREARTATHDAEATTASCNPLCMIRYCFGSVQFLIDGLLTGDPQRHRSRAVLPVARGSGSCDQPEPESPRLIPNRDPNSDSQANPAPAAISTFRRLRAMQVMPFGVSRQAASNLKSSSSNFSFAEGSRKKFKYIIILLNNK